MTKTTVVSIIGNCQAQFLESMFLFSNRQLHVNRIQPSFMFTPSDKDRVMDLLEQSDWIFAQRVSDTYETEWIRPKFLLEKFAGKVLIWPNLYFNGYFPDVRYIYLKNYGKLHSPLGDYHFGKIINAHQTGQPLAAAIAQLKDFKPAPEEDFFRLSLDQLRQREKDVSIIMSDFIEKEIRNTKCFYTPNHPINFLLIELVSRLAKAAGIDVDLDSLENFSYKLDIIKIKCHPYIYATQNIKFADTEEYIGHELIFDNTSVSLGGTMAYSLEKMVEMFYKVYDITLPLSEKRTPSKVYAQIEND